MCNVGIILTIVLVWYTLYFSKSVIFISNFAISTKIIILQIIVLLFTLVVSIISKNYFVKKEQLSSEFFVFLLIALLGLVLILSSNNFISLFVSIETTNLAFFLMVASRKESEYSTEAALKYFILGSISSVVLLLAISYFYAVTGSVSFGEIFTISSYPMYHWKIFGFFPHTVVLLLMIGILFKLGSVPFHSWLPDVYEGAPTPVTAYFSIVPKIIYINLFFKLFIYSFYWINKAIFPTLLLVSVLSILFGNLLAYGQEKIKRMLAYSTIAQTGYILLAVSSNDYMASISAYFYIIIYMVSSLALFSVILNVRDVKYSIQIKYLSEFINLRHSNVYLSTTIMVVLVSLTGLPPFSTFFGKLYIFLNVLNTDTYILSIAIMLFSLIGITYYMYLVRLSNEDIDSNFVILSTLPKLSTITLSVSIIILSSFLFFPRIFLSIPYIISI